MKTTFADVATAALGSINTLLAEWLPDGHRSGREWIARNPTRADGKPGSFSVNLATGAWADFATGDRGGDLISLHAYLTGQTQLAAAADLASQMGMEWANGNAENNSAGTARRPFRKQSCTTTPPPDGKSRSEGKISEPPQGALSLPPKITHSRHGEPSAVWTYTDAEGRPLWIACRFNHPDGSKDVLPLCWHGDRWRWKALPAPRPLYHLPNLLENPAAPVVITEGEKAADAAQELLADGAVVTTWAGGCKAYRQTDWAPLAGRSVICWPDADAPGAQAMESIAATLRELGAAVAVADLPPGLPPGWDAADLASDPHRERFTPAAFALTLLEGTATAPDGLCPLCWAGRIAAPLGGPTCYHIDWQWPQFPPPEPLEPLENDSLLPEEAVFDSALPSVDSGILAAEKIAKPSART